MWTVYEMATAGGPGRKTNTGQWFRLAQAYGGGAGCLWPAPSTTPHNVSKPSEELLKALKLLQSVTTKEDFSKYEKMVMPPPPKREERVKLREEELLEKCKKEESLKKQEQMHEEQVKHQHNLEQQKLMLHDVQLRLASMSLEVKALRALVAGTKEPEGHPIHAPLPVPWEPSGPY